MVRPRGLTAVAVVALAVLVPLASADSAGALTGAGTRRAAAAGWTGPAGTQRHGPGGWAGSTPAAPSPQPQPAAAGTAALAVAPPTDAPTSTTSATTVPTATAVSGSTATVNPPASTGGSGNTITFVNSSGKKIWIGSAASADGSQALSGLPTLDPGASGSVVVPAAGHWRGTFFARQDCTGSGSAFHCAVGDCGASESSCVAGQQPVSLAEFNLDPADAAAPWYDVSYVDAVSLPITITPAGATSSGGSTCAPAGCPEPLLGHCPANLLQLDGSGQPQLCVNPNRDAVTAYSDAISTACPKAYAWSKQDTVPGNQTVQNCPQCNGFTVTFHSN